jgi:pimeloyl-ACP methyl ester carboxylesterase
MAVFFGGFRSDMTGTKADALAARALRAGRGFLRFDYMGHGTSGGRFEDGTIGRWRDDALRAVDALTEGSLILVGSSMGGWIMLLVALARRERVRGLIGVASAPDFTEELIWKRASPEDRERLRRDGRILVESSHESEGYPLSARLIDEAREHLVLPGPIELDCPTRLLHGLADDEVPWDLSLRLARGLGSRDVGLVLVKDGDHRLSDPRSLARLEATLGSLEEQVGR